MKFIFKYEDAIRVVFILNFIESKVIQYLFHYSFVFWERTLKYFLVFVIKPECLLASTMMDNHRRVSTEECRKYQQIISSCPCTLQYIHTMLLLIFSMKNENWVDMIVPIFNRLSSSRKIMDLKWMSETKGKTGMHG